MTGARRVAVTGVGVVAPGGIGIANFWGLLTAGRTATRRITRFDASAYRSQVAAECDFSAAEAGLTPRQRQRCDLYQQYALAAAKEAVADSGFDDADTDPYRCGTSLGSAVGGTIRLEEGYVLACDTGRTWTADPRHVPAFGYEALVPSSLASEVAVEFGLRGPAATISTGCTAGLDAVGHAATLIAEGEADLMVTGASESPISPITVACFDAIKATTPRNDDPEHASRPFDNSRDGFVLGEGAAVLVLEELSHARRRGARIYCEVSGFASRSNAYHMTGLTPEGIEMSWAIDSAMQQAKLNPDEIDYINAHGSGTRQNDLHETAAFKRSLGAAAYEASVSSIKSMIGHSLGAIGSIEVVACVLAIEHGVVPPTANLTNQDPKCDLDYIPLVAREQQVRNVLSVGSGFGGFQSAMLLSKEVTRA